MYAHSSNTHVLNGNIITLSSVKYKRRRGGPSKNEMIREAGPSNYLRGRRLFLRDHTVCMAGPCEFNNSDFDFRDGL